MSVRSLQQNAPIILVGPKPDPRSDLADRFLDEITMVLQKYDTETLKAIAEYRFEIHPDGWMQRLINEYVEVWR